MKVTVGEEIMTLVGLTVCWETKEKFEERQLDLKRICKGKVTQDFTLLVLMTLGKKLDGQEDKIRKMYSEYKRSRKGS